MARKYDLIGKNINLEYETNKLKTIFNREFTCGNMLHSNVFIFPISYSIPQEKFVSKNYNKNFVYYLIIVIYISYLINLNLILVHLMM